MAPVQDTGHCKLERLSFLTGEQGTEVIA